MSMSFPLFGCLVVHHLKVIEGEYGFEFFSIFLLKGLIKFIALTFILVGLLKYALVVPDKEDTHVR